MRYELAIFDLDGTLLDTLEDLADSLNFILTNHGYPPRTLEEVRAFVGNGIHKLIERSLPDKATLEETEETFQDFIVYYGKHCMEKTKPYDGILELLKTLKTAGCRLAVVSNKADYAVRILCDNYFPNLLDKTFGEQEGIPKKPAPDLVKKVLTDLRIKNTNAVYIGDSDVDIATAFNANMDEIIVDWGFRDYSFLKAHGAKKIVSSPKEIVEIIMQTTI